MLLCWRVHLLGQVEGVGNSWHCLGSVSQRSRKCKLHLIYFNSHIYGLAWHADENGIAKCRRWHKTAPPLAVVACMFRSGKDEAEATQRLLLLKCRQAGRERIKNKKRRIGLRWVDYLIPLRNYCSVAETFLMLRHHFRDKCWTWINIWPIYEGTKCPVRLVEW